jgi:hypothetical protein
LLDLRRPVIHHGTFYVGFSRVREFRHLGVVVNKSDIGPDGVARVKNIVIRELLVRARLIPPNEA